MATMKSVQTGTAPNTVDVVEIERPVPGPRDVVVRVRACGICGTDVSFLHMGGAPFGPGGSMIPLPLGHEPAGEIVEAGAEVTGLKAGDRVVVNPQGVPSGIIGCGGELGGMREYLLIEGAAVGKNVAVFPDTVPFDVAALNEPMAVARHCVNRSGARPADKVVVFGAGPIGLGAAIWLKLRGVEHVTVADVIPERLETALAIGADAVINSATEDVTARLTELHGEAVNALGQPRAGTDIYIDAAGAPAVFDATVASAKWGAKMVMVAVQKKSAAIDLGGMLRSELTLIASQGYPTEIFEVTPEIVEHQERFARLISHRVPFSEVGRAFDLTLTPGAAEKVVVTFDGPAA
ncbi:zinc-dependent alcohol dehydrogenase [Streptomyces paludis]|uniref:2-deoxy-scyllo-inosamine dehydrogenase n=1 Tax=Streptomyces paludis TaxID=2282738 RepID=A0A345HY96_9ACTN|nr:zinc-binding dehydrogenase [Streptomyces paludis]AXG81670.1 theronine dehydrogenase [Streptomyces paludis]